MAALRIDAQLRLVDRGEGEIAAVLALALHRHAFGGAQIIARALGHDPLFTRDQRDLAGALHLNDAVVNFAGQQAQREADDPRRMGAHPFDRQVGLAGVGGAENGPKNTVGRGGHGSNLGMDGAKRKRLSRSR
jgi:hypothetical protein